MKLPVKYKGLTGKAIEGHDCELYIYEGTSDQQAKHVRYINILKCHYAKRNNNQLSVFALSIMPHS